MPDLAKPPAPERQESRDEYVRRVNRAIDHILRELASPLRLTDVARVACFSPFHFHRVFQSLMGETLRSFVRRVRLERAAHLMAHRRGATLTEVAIECGFASSSDFSRAFKEHFGAAPSVFDLTRHRQRGRQRLGALQTELDADEFECAVVDVTPRRVVYERVLRPYEGSAVRDAYTRMLGWARARGLAAGQWLGYQWDDPEIAPLEQCRYDVGLEVPEGVSVEAPLGEVRFPPMRVAEVRMRGTTALELRALDWLYGRWLPSSGYVPDDQPGFEAWDGEPFANGDDEFALRLQIPVVPAR